MADITVIDLLVRDTKYTQHEALGPFFVPSGNWTKNVLPITSVIAVQASHHAPKLF